MKQEKILTLMLFFIGMTIGLIVTYLIYLAIKP